MPSLGAEVAIVIPTSAPLTRATVLFVNRRDLKVILSRMSLLTEGLGRG